MISFRNRLVSAIRGSVLAASLPAVFLLTFHPAMADVPRSVEERGDVRDESDSKKVCGRVGQIFIVGNTVTRDSIILEQLPLFPGAVFTLADLRTAERNLARLKIFKADPPPRVRIIDQDNPGDSTIKDIRVDVTERPGNIYFWPVMESLQFAAVWCVQGLPAAILVADEGDFPIELIRFALTGDETACPLVISQWFTK
jgi:hypothetical protein